MSSWIIELLEWGFPHRESAEKRIITRHLFVPSYSGTVYHRILVSVLIATLSIPARMWALEDSYSFTFSSGSKIFYLKLLPPPRRTSSTQAEEHDDCES